MTGPVEAAASWLLVLALHSTCWLAFALVVAALLRDRALAWQELILRMSLFAPVLTSLLQCVSGGPLWGGIGWLAGAFRGDAVAAAGQAPPGDGWSAGATSGWLPWGGPVPDGPVAPGKAAGPLADGLRSLDPLAQAPASLPSGAADLGAAAAPWLSPELVLAGRHTAALLVLAVAAVLAALGLCWLLRQHRQLARALAGRRPERCARLLAIAAEVAADLGLRHTPRLSRCEQIGSPIAFGVLRPEVSLPPRTAELGDPELRALFGHELAHVRRADALWLWSSAVLHALMPWQLLLAPLRRRLHVVAELRCDAAAAAQSGPFAVAECLVQVAAWIERRPAPRGALAMAARPSVLRRRVEAALAEREEGRLGPWAAMTLSVVLLAVFTAAAPGIAVPVGEAGVLAGAGPSSAAPSSAGPSSVGSPSAAPKTAAPPAADPGPAGGGSAPLADDLPAAASGRTPAVADVAPSPAPAVRADLRALFAVCLAEQRTLLREAAAVRTALADVRDDPELGRMLDLIEVQLAQLQSTGARLASALNSTKTVPQVPERSHR